MKTAFASLLTVGLVRQPYNANMVAVGFQVYSRNKVEILRQRIFAILRKLLFCFQ